MNDNEWICPNCGFHNPYTLHIALKDICIKCREPKQIPEERDIEREFRRDALEREAISLKENIRTSEEWIQGLESEIFPEREKLARLVAEYGEIIREIEELYAPPAEPATRQDTQQTKLV
jgi:hypothetical protein